MGIGPHSSFSSVLTVGILQLAAFHLLREGFEHKLQRKLLLPFAVLRLHISVFISSTLLQGCESSENSSDKNTAVPDGEVNAATTSQNGTLHSIKAKDSPSFEADSSRKSKKRKKDKSHDGDEAENCREDVQPDLSSSTKSVTKKKKRKHQDDVVDTSVNTVCENGDKNAAVAEECGRKDKKSAKKRKRVGDVHGSLEGTDAVNAGENC